MSSEGLTSTAYIKHHLTNLTYGQHSDGSWGFAHSAEEIKEMGFWALQVDSLAWSVLTALFFLYFSVKLPSRQLLMSLVGYKILSNGLLNLLMTVFEVHSVRKMI